MNNNGKETLMQGGIEKGYTAPRPPAKIELEKALFPYFQVSLKRLAAIKQEQAEFEKTTMNAFGFGASGRGMTMEEIAAEEQRNAASKMAKANDLSYRRSVIDAELKFFEFASKKFPDAADLTNRFREEWRLNEEQLNVLAQEIRKLNELVQSSRGDIQNTYRTELGVLQKEQLGLAARSEAITNILSRME